MAASALLAACAPTDPEDQAIRSDPDLIAALDVIDAALEAGPASWSGTFDALEPSLAALDARWVAGAGDAQRATS